MYNPFIPAAHNPLYGVGYNNPSETNSYGLFASFLTAGDAEKFYRVIHGPANESIGVYKIYPDRLERLI